MFDHSFFSSKVGHAALVSVAAMIAFTVFAQMQHEVASAHSLLTISPLVELA
ncbi:hypothetical protein GRI62_02890 [Erythrobacter arachoides]|uniref:Uncharacterized protein n=1 Tax=Aurantiacibacter arachoides TaxID=1850444 RepID=A0A844ZW80_9SPHN|nr:hypothetical protein [Aurantiacibacter arachoides]MXO92551.1 hypothetical protein [Aurantiacibacter arachoides]GGD56299.1 hypothetical protein GCM10011411_15370 [Aurantiacibacter arachoides]